MPAPEPVARRGLSQMDDTAVQKGAIPARSILFGEGQEDPCGVEAGRQASGVEAEQRRQRVRLRQVGRLPGQQQLSEADGVGAQTGPQRVARVASVVALAEEEIE